MALPLVHLKGISAHVPSSVKPHPTIPGNIVYVAGCQVVVMDERDQGRQQFLRAHTSQITAFDVSPGGRFVASAQAAPDPDVILWDLQSGRPFTKFSEHDHGVACVAFSQDDRLLLSVGPDKDQRLFVLDTATGNIVSKAALEYGKMVTACAFAPCTARDVYTFATAFGNELVLWTLNPFTGLVSPRPVVAGSVRRHYTSLVFSADGQWLYAGSSSGDVVTVNVMRVAIQMTHPACSAGVGALVLSSGGKLLVGGGDGSITLLSTDHMWRDMRPFMTVPGSITSLTPTTDGAFLIVGTADGSAYKVASGSLQMNTITQGPSTPMVSLAAHPGGAGVYAAGCADGRIMVYDVHHHSLQQVIAADPSAGAPQSLAITPDNCIISGWADGTVRAFALQPATPPGGGGGGCVPGCKLPGQTTAPVWSVPGAHALAHSSGVTALQAGHKGQLFATGGAGGEIRLWNMKSRQMLGHMKLHNSRINQIQILADDGHLIAACEDHALSAWDMGAQKCKATWRLPNAVRSVASCPDQVTFMSVGQDKNITVWDLRSPDPVSSVANAHDAPIAAIAVQPQSTLFATGGTDCAVKLWDVRCLNQPQGCAPLAVGTAHTGAVGCVAFHPTGALISGAADNCVAVWQP